MSLHVHASGPKIVKAGNVHPEVKIGLTAGAASAALILLHVPFLVSCGLGVALIFILADRVKEKRL